jgi:hypothetical protein
VYNRDEATTSQYPSDYIRFITLQQPDPEHQKRSTNNAHLREKEYIRGDERYSRILEELD